MLSYALVDRGNFGQVVSIDNDVEVIKHMSAMYQGDQRLKWYAYDIITGESLNSHSAEHLMDEKYDIIIDKGTLDAVLVEGSIYTMLHDVYRLLKPTGIYFVCSIFSFEMLQPLLSLPVLGYHVEYSAISDESDNKTVGNIYICRKICQLSRSESGYHAIDIEELAREEDRVMHDYFKSKQPILTTDKQQSIKKQFESFHLSKQDLNVENDHDITIEGDYITLTDAYRIMFGEELSLGYSYDLFLEDIQNFPLSRENHMNSTEAIEFLRIMQ